MVCYTRVGECAEITLNRPEKGNALNMPMIEELGAIAARVRTDGSVRVVILRGNGRFFCTGGDINAWGSLTPEEMANDWILPGIRVFDEIATLPQPVIAVLSGHALGGGLELALAADLRVAIESAKLGMPEVTLGMISGWMGVRRLAETIGVARARQMSLLGAPIGAAQGLEWGLVHAVGKDAQDVERIVSEWVARLCANGAHAMALTKEILATMHLDLREQHMRAAADAASSEECRERVRAFREKA